MINHFLYIGMSAHKNFQKGMDANLWGSKFHNRISAIQTGDNVYFVTSCIWDKSIFGSILPKGYPRVDEGEYKGLSRKVYHCIATSNVNEQQNKDNDIWGGGYNFQFSFNKVEEFIDVIISPTYLNPVISEKIRKSISSRFAETTTEPVNFSPKKICYSDDFEQGANYSEGENEGRKYLSKHMKLERDRGLVVKKIKDFFKKNGRLYCEICRSDYRQSYQQDFDYGKGFDVHHIKPLSETGETITKISDLIIVCPNCHRVLHSQVPCLHPDRIIKS